MYYKITGQALSRLTTRSEIKVAGMALYPFTAELALTLKHHQIEPKIEPHNELDGIDGEDRIWLAQRNDGSSWLGDYISVQRAHLESDDWVISYSSRHAFGGDPEHWSEIGTQTELMPNIVAFFLKQHCELREAARPAPERAD